MGSFGTFLLSILLTLSVTYGAQTEHWEFGVFDTPGSVVVAHNEGEFGTFERTKEFNLAVLTDRKEVWKDTELHGRFNQALHDSGVHFSASMAYLRFSNLFEQLKVWPVRLSTYTGYIMKQMTVDVCRTWHRPGESIGHSGYSRLADSEYFHMHNEVGRIIHQYLALKYNFVDSEVPECYVITYVKVEVRNKVSNPKVDFDPHTSVVTISYKLWQHSRSTYDIVARAVWKQGCIITQTLKKRDRNF